MFNACSQRPLRTRYCEAFARRALDPVRHKKRKRTLWEDFCAKPVLYCNGGRFARLPTQRTHEGQGDAQPKASDLGGAATKLSRQHANSAREREATDSEDGTPYPARARAPARFASHASAAQTPDCARHALDAIRVTIVSPHRFKRCGLSQERAAAALSASHVHTCDRTHSTRLTHACSLFCSPPSKAWRSAM